MSINSNWVLLRVRDVDLRYAPDGASSGFRRPNVRRVSCSEAPRACGSRGTPRAADCSLTRLRAA